MNTRQLRRLVLTFATLFACAQAQTTWDGGGESDGSWGELDNWDNNTLPSFDGTNSLTITRHAAFVSTAGSGYTNPVTVSITGGGGSGATATATQNSGAINAFTITNGGTGFASLPTVTISGGAGAGAVANISLTSAGTVAMAGTTTMSLGADRSISRITFGGGSTAYTLNGNTLRLNSTSTTAGAGTALWNASTADGVSATVNSNILLQSGTAGTYTGHFRENNNSSGGTTFNGQITQGAGENWTMHFTRASTRGSFFLNNASNSIAGILVAGADVRSSTIGSFGTALLTMSSGSLGSATNDHYTTSIANNILMTTGASTWSSGVQTRLTGNMDQNTRALTYAGAGLTYVDYASMTSTTGTTTISGGNVAVSSMSKLAPGTLSMGGGRGVMILSGTGGNGVPTWSDFSTARTYNQSGGAGTWNINSGVADGSAGGFAARGADLVIPASGGGLSNTTFARHLALGSTATLDGNRYADHAVKIETDIAYAAGDNYEIYVAHNTQVARSATNWTFGGPVHELAGQISGDNMAIIPYATTTSSGLLRISNATNSLTNTGGASAWVLGSTRGTLTTQSGRSVGGGNHKDNSNAVVIFTSDAAFGGAADVMVNAVASSGSTGAGYLFLEDANAMGSTTFGRNFRVNATTGAGAGFGAWGGDVVYQGDGAATGVIDFTGSSVDLPLSAENGATLRFGTAGGDAAHFVNNRTGASFVYNTAGSGTISLNNVVFSGTQTNNSWNVREGTLRVNMALNQGNITVSNGGTLGGTGSITGNVTVQSGGTYAPGNSPGLLSHTGDLLLQNGSQSVFEIDNDVRGTGYDATDVTGNLTYDGTLTLDFGSVFANDTYSFNLFDWTGTLGGSFDAVNLAGSYSGSLTNASGVWSHTDLDGNEWTFTQADGVLAFTAIPEPGVLVLLGLGVLLVRFGLRRRR